MLPTWDLRVPNIFQVSAYPPAMFIEGTCTAGRDDDIVSVPFSRECAEEKEKEEREQCKYGT